MKLGILETGRPPDALAHLGSYPEMMARWLEVPDSDPKSYAVLDMEFPGSWDEADVWVITGSRFGTYENHDWIAPLEDFIRSVHANGGLMVGICFGHQIIAQALGGVVRKSDKGWGVGVHDYRVQDWPDSLGRAPDDLHFQVFHQDQVEELPSGAQRVASSEFCENAAIWYPNFAITFQGHPEFSSEFVTGLIDTRGKELFTDDVSNTARATVNNPTSSNAVAAQIRDWLRSTDKATQS